MPLFAVRPETVEIYFDESFAIGFNTKQLYPSWIKGVKQNDNLKVYTFDSSKTIDSVRRVSQLESIKPRQTEKNSNFDFILIEKVFPESKTKTGFVNATIDKVLSFDVPKKLLMITPSALEKINLAYSRKGLDDRELFRTHDNSENYYFSVYITRTVKEPYWRSMILDRNIPNLTKKIECWDLLNQIEASRPVDWHQKNIKAEVLSLNTPSIFLAYSRDSPATGERVVEEKRYIFLDDQTIIVSIGYSEKFRDDIKPYIAHMWDSLAYLEAVRTSWVEQ